MLYTIFVKALSLKFLKSSCKIVCLARIFTLKVSLNIVAFLRGKVNVYKTERLLIRKFEFKDWQAVYEYTSDINVMKYIPEGVLLKKIQETL